MTTATEQQTAIQNMINAFLGCPQDQAFRSLTNLLTTCPKNESEFWQAVFKGYMSATENA